MDQKLKTSNKKKKEKKTQMIEAMMLFLLEMLFSVILNLPEVDQ
jgi:hypothetical protein